MINRKGIVKERPNFGDKQVKKASEIEIGKKYRRHHAIGTDIVFPIQLGVGRVGAKTINQESVTAKDIEIADIKDESLMDWGVIPYKNGMWNATNWLEKLEEEERKCLKSI